MNRRNRCKAKVRLYPDPILKVVCEPVHDDEDVSDVIRDMMYILTNSKTGVGLAAPQAGYTKRVIIVKVCNFAYVPMINPEIESFCSDGEIAKEGCLSYPGIFRYIYRPNWIRLSYITSNGRNVIDEYNDFDARIIQHEIDHLDGKCKIGE